MDTNLTLRSFEDNDIEIFKHWLYQTHVAKWYTEPDEWLTEIIGRHDEYAWIHHFIVMLGDTPIGFCQYYDCYCAHDLEEWHQVTLANKIYSIDYLIGEEVYLHKGYGKALVSLLSKTVFEQTDAKEIIVLPDQENHASNHVLLASGFCFDKEKRYYRKAQDIIIRQETPADYKEIYELVKMAFATVDFSDGTEADYLNKIRTKDTFIPELSLVAETSDGKLVGQIVLYRTWIQTINGVAETLVLSPISVHPDYFRCGIARSLIKNVSQIATNMGFTSVFLCGDPMVYRKLGFIPSYTFNICHIDDPKAEWCMGREFVPNALASISGTIDIL